MRLLHVARDLSLFLSAAGAGRGARRHRAPSRRCIRASARRPGHAKLRRTACRPGRHADVGPGARERAGSAEVGRGRQVDAALWRLRRDHRPQVPVAARALDGRGRPRRGGRVAHGPPGRVRHARAPRRARARPRPGRRVECDLGEAGAARFRRVGARASAPALHRARVRAVAGARADRAAGRLAPRAARRLGLPPRLARIGARSGRPHPRGGRLLRGDARGAPAQAGARRRRSGGGAAARGQGGPARRGRRRRGLAAGGHRVPSGLASCPPR